MKTNLFQLILLVAFGFLTNAVQAQTKADEAALKSFWKDVWTAYDSGNDDKMFAYYTENACEINPGGIITCGKKALIDSWNQFMKMVDTRPKFSFSDPSVRFITPEVGIISWDSGADIKIKGQQIGGKTKGMAVVHKINGKWLIEFDSLTPVMQMPSN